MDPVARRARYAKLSTALSLLDDEALRGFLPRSGRRGNTHSVEVAGEQVFVKVIPLTDLERDRPYSTRNHYRLPTYYQYGVGSAGFGAWRELVTHVTTTNWVLEDAIATFPLTFHWRVVRRPSLIEPFIENGLDEYVRSWNSSRNIGRYMTERGSGSHAALIFLEHLPHSMWDWLAAHPEDTDRLTRQLCDTVTFLRGHGVVHFDAHFNNAMTDGEYAYLADYGLAMDSRFDLTERERAFLARHTDFDYGSIVFSVAPQLALWFRALPEAEQESIRERLDLDDDRVPVHLALVRGAEGFDGLAPPTLLDAVVRYRDVIEFLSDFFVTLGANKQKNTPFDEVRLGELLRAAGVNAA